MAVHNSILLMHLLLVYILDLTVYILYKCVVFVSDGSKGSYKYHTFGQKEGERVSLVCVTFVIDSSTHCMVPQNKNYPQYTSSGHWLMVDNINWSFGTFKYLLLIGVTTSEFIFDFIQFLSIISDYFLNNFLNFNCGCSQEMLCAT